LLTRLAQDARQLDRRFDLPAASFAFAAGGIDQIPVGRDYPAEVVFIPVADDISPPLQPITPWPLSGRLIVPIPVTAASSQDAIDPQAGLDGPSLAVRRALVAAGLDQGKNARFLILGGSLPASRWGDPQMARASFQYMNAHPWIRFLTPRDLTPMSPTSLAASSTTNEMPVAWPVELELLSALQAAPDNRLAEAAWQAYLALHAPVYPAPARLSELRRHYTGQVGVLLAAARWANNPLAQSDCSQDLDFDTLPECILASERFFGVFEPQGGNLAYAFVLLENRPHQLIGPSSQFIAGLSDPAGWDLGRGLTADPAVIPGAFADTRLYQPDIEPGRLVFTSLPDSPIHQKTFELLESGLRVTITGKAPTTLQVPFALDPWLRFIPDWADQYRGGETETGWFWEATPIDPTSGDGPMRVDLESPTHLLPRTFKDSSFLLDRPEDPNRDYPAGHFLTFPLALFEVPAAEQVVIDLRISVPAD
jgi:hypothetical protein